MTIHYAEQEFMEGAYGFKVFFKSGATFKDEGEPIPQIVIIKPTQPKIVRDVDEIDYESGDITVIIRDGDFNEAGKYSFEVMQVGTGYKYLSGVAETSVQESLHPSNT